MKTLLSMALFVPLLGSLSFPQALWAQAVLENPQRGSLQSGIGVISGWVCEAERIEIVFHPDTDHAMTFQAGYGTNREDTAGECHDSNNGFGLLFNWNRLGDGQHTVSARADGVEFGRATVTVTTLGGEFLEEASGYFIVEDFSTPDEDIQLRWQQTTQNFVITANPALAGPAKTEAALFSPLMKNGQPPVSPLTGGGRPDSSPLTGGGTPARVLENPQPVSLQSGIGVISGWVCEAERIEIVFHPDTDHAMTFQAGYGTSREDTEGECHDSNNGFGLLFNWNRLGDGQHTVSARADGVEFGRATVTVTTFGQEFLEGVGKHARLQNFPETGTDLIVAWQQSLQNFTIARLDSLSPRIAAIDAIGDSISKAVNAQDQAPCPHDDQESFNWATSITAGARCSDGGDGVYSLAERIECRQGAMIVNADPNSGESGAEMLKDFFAQAQESAALLGTQPAPRYVTVEMGHNDICSGTLERIQADCAEGEDQDPINHCRTTPAAFEREFRKGLDVLLTVPELNIGIAAPVRVSQLCNHATKTNCSILGGSCADQWVGVVVLRPTGVCGSITLDCSDQRLQDGYETARVYRDIMARVSSEYAALAEGESSAVVSIGGETVGGAVKADSTSLSFSNAAWTYKFTSEQLSCCDCFHPSFLGQDTAARVLFDGFTCSPTDVCCADTGDPVSDALCTTEDTGGTFQPGLF